MAGDDRTRWALAVAAIESELAVIDQAQKNAQRMLATLRRELGGRKRQSPSKRPQDLRYAGMTVAEAAVALGVGEEHLRRLLRRGEIAGVGFGGRVGWRLSRDYVEELARELAEAKAGQEAGRRTLAQSGGKRTGRPPKTHAGKLKRRVQ